MIISIFSILGQTLLFLLVKLAFLLGVIKYSTFNNFLIWIIKLNGPISIKMFQVLSSTSDLKRILGDDFVKKICSLQDQVYPNRKRLLKEFDYQNINPIASGTIGQVYTIQLTKKKTGILKLCHSNITNELNNSVKKLKLLLSMFKLVNRRLYNLLKYLNLNEFKNFLLVQTDFNYEAKNILKFQDIYKEYDFIIIPKLIDHSKDYLVMSKETGYHIKKFGNLYPEFKEEAVALIYSTLFVMIKNKIIHGDLHFGNFLFKLLNNKVHITLLDFGIVCHISDEQSKYLIKYLKSTSKEKKRENLINFTRSILINKVNFNTDLNFINLNDKELLDYILSNDNIEIPSNFASLYSTLRIVLELHHECCKKNPQFNHFLFGYLIENDFD